MDCTIGNPGTKHLVLDNLKTHKIQMIHDWLVKRTRLLARLGRVLVCPPEPSTSRAWRIHQHS